MRRSISFRSAASVLLRPLMFFTLNFGRSFAAPCPAPFAQLRLVETLTAENCRFLAVRCLVVFVEDFVAVFGGEGAAGWFRGRVHRVFGRRYGVRTAHGWRSSHALGDSTSFTASVSSDRDREGIVAEALTPHGVDVRWDWGWRQWIAFGVGLLVPGLLAGWKAPELRKWWFKHVKPDGETLSLKWLVGLGLFGTLVVAASLIYWQAELLTLDGESVSSVESPELLDITRSTAFSLGAIGALLRF